MGSVADDPATDRPREWLALPGGGIRPGGSVSGPRGIAELLADGAWRRSRYRSLADSLASRCCLPVPRASPGRGPCQSSSWPVVLSTWSGISPSCRSPVLDVPDGSNMRIEAPGDEGLCSVPFGTTNGSPGRSVTVV